jgi:nucleotide-binding universal stress UspA family protein
MEDAMACPLTRGKRILVPVDGSNNADQAVNQAISLGEVCNSIIYTLSVAELRSEVLAEAPQLFEKIEKGAGDIAAAARDKVLQAGLNGEAISMTTAEPAEAILEVAKDMEIDLIVMGTRGLSRMKRFFLGSVAQKVVGQAPCPVMVVPSS